MCTASKSGDMEVNMVNRLKKLTNILFVSCLMVTLVACGATSEDQAVECVKSYMKAEETGDQTALMKCMDPAIQETSKGLTNTVAGLFNIENGYDTGNAFGTLVNGAMRDMINVDISYKFEKVYESELEDDDGTITVQYSIKASSKSDGDESSEVSVIIPFDMIKREKKWYISKVGTAKLVKDENGNEITPSKITIELGRTFSNEVAWISSGKLWKCIDKTGDVLFELESGQMPKTDFNNDIAVIETADGRGSVINKSGDIIISPEKQGYDKIVLPIQRGASVKDEYIWNGKSIIVFKELNTFDKSENQIGVLDETGEWISPLSGNSVLGISEKLDRNMTIEDKYYKIEVVNNYDRNWVKTSSGGYYTGNSLFYNPLLGKSFYTGKYGDDIYIAEDTGICFTDSSVLKVSGSGVSDIKILNDVSSIGELNDGMFFALKNDGSSGFYDLSGNLLFDLSEYTSEKGKLKNKPVMYNGYAIIEITNPSNKTFFTVIDKNGKRMFEPIEGNPSTKVLEGFVVYNDGKQKKRVIDAQGNEKFADISEYLTNIGDGAAMVNSPSVGIYYIDLNGDNLF